MVLIKSGENYGSQRESRKKTSSGAIDDQKLVQDCSLLLFVACLFLCVFPGKTLGFVLWRSSSLSSSVIAASAVVWCVVGRIGELSLEGVESCKGGAWAASPIAGTSNGPLRWPERAPFFGLAVTVALWPPPPSAALSHRRRGCEGANGIANLLGTKCPFLQCPNSLPMGRRPIIGQGVVKSLVGTALRDVARLFEIRRADVIPVPATF